MARVACCPQCAHDLLVPDDADGEAWAKCPECQASFQLKQAASRDVSALLLVEPDQLESGGKSERTLDDFSSLATLRDPAIDRSDANESPEREAAPDIAPTLDYFPPPAALREPGPQIDEIDADELRAIEAEMTIAWHPDESSSDAAQRAPELDQIEANEPPEQDAKLNIAQPAEGDEITAAADRIDQWFRSAKATIDTAIESDGATIGDDQAAIPPADEITPSRDDAHVQRAGTTIGAGDVNFTPPGSTSTEANIDLSNAGLYNVESNDDVEIEKTLASPIAETNVPAWDDSHHMERLLADIDSRPTIEIPSGRAIPAIDTGEWGKDERPVEFNPESMTTRNEAWRKKRSPVRSLVMIALSGVVGLTVGYYALLWWYGPSGDFLQIAHYLPSATLPQSFHPMLTKFAATPQVEPAPAIEETADADEPESTVDVTTDATGDTAEVQAGYTAPAEPAAPVPQTVGDRYATGASDTATEEAATEPATLDAPPAVALTDSEKSETTKDESIQIANAPSFSSEELNAALEAAKKVQPDLVAGSLSDSKDVARAKGYSYSMLADLAQKATFVEAPAQSNEPQPLQQATAELFRQTLADQHTRGEVAVILPKWLASPNRKHGGVFFAASATSQDGSGQVTAYQTEEGFGLAECQAHLEGGAPITLLLPGSRAGSFIGSSQPLGIVGWIVDNPTQQVSGYTGTAKQAVWVSHLIPLE